MTDEAVKVIVRCRPLNDRERSLKCKEVIFIDTNRGQCSISHPVREKDTPKCFSFDGAYGVDSTTEQVYADIVYPLVEGVTEGYNGTIFAYGQTGCGKSFTMQGGFDSSDNKGITPRSFDHIFETTAASENCKFLVHASFLEIYNEEIRDLLGKDPKAKFDIKEHPEKGIVIPGLSIHKVKSVADCKVIMDQGWRNRSTGATLMNADSSRSHSVFTIFLEIASTDAETGREHIRAGKLNLVDLAGSERQAKTGAVGDRLKEATKINLSLSALGNVISALVDANTKHIPYRDSKLTRLLQDSLGGNTKTLMIACLSPADNNYEETLSTLRYANRAKNIKNKPIINEDPKDALLRQYQEEITRLKLLLSGQATIPTSLQLDNTLKALELEPSPVDTNTISEEKELLRMEYEKKLKETEEKYAEEAASNAKLQEELTKMKEFYYQKLQKLEEKATFLPESIDDGDTEFLYNGNQDGSLTSRTYKIPSHECRLDLIQKSSQPQFAVHLATTGLVGVTHPLDGISSEYDKLTKEDLLRRLQMLEGDFVGGERADDVVVKEKRLKRRRHVEERKRLLAEANANLEDDGIMIGIYESIQDELRHKNKLLEKEKQKVSSLTMEIEDIQSEFELEREDYLESIRKQSRQISLLQAILERIQPCIRRDSNYANIDKVKKQACFDDDSNEWILPALSLERTVLPLSQPANLEDSGAFKARNNPIDPQNCRSTFSVSGSRCHFARDPAVDKEDEDRLYAKIASRTQNYSNYFTNKRKDQLLMDAAYAGSSQKTHFQNVSNSDKAWREMFPNNSSSQFGGDREGQFNYLPSTKRNPTRTKRNPSSNKNVDFRD